MRLLTKWFRALGGRAPTEAAAETTWTQGVARGTKAYREGDYATAEARFAAAFKRAEVNGSLNHRAAAALNNLALVYKRQKRLDHAEVTLRRALRAYAVIEPEGPRIASVLNNLAGVYLAQRRYDEAASAYQQTIAVTEKIFGSEHPKLAKRLENYARVLDATKDAKGAKQLRDRAQAIRAGAKTTGN